MWSVTASHLISIPFAWTNISSKWNFPPKKCWDPSGGAQWILTFSKCASNTLKFLALLEVWYGNGGQETPNPPNLGIGIFVATPRRRRRWWRSKYALGRSGTHFVVLLLWFGSQRGPRTTTTVKSSRRWKQQTRQFLPLHAYLHGHCCHIRICVRCVHGWRRRRRWSLCYIKEWKAQCNCFSLLCVGRHTYKCMCVCKISFFPLFWDFFLYFLLPNFGVKASFRGFLSSPTLGGCSGLQCDLK